ncbi:hypothetical protein Tco_0829493 [Tanacetum coccineum]
MKDKNSRYLEVESTYLELLKDLEHQMIEQDNVKAAYLNQKAALDYQKQLLSRHKDEVDEMNERLAYERANFVDEKYKFYITITEEPFLLKDLVSMLGVYFRHDLFQMGCDDCCNLLEMIWVIKDPTVTCRGNDRMA